MMYDGRNWIGFFILGAINNLPYVIVNSASRTIANSFGVTNFVGLVFGANVSLALVVKLLNTFLLLRVSYGLRITVNGILMLIGLFGVAYAFNFPFAIACIAISGSSAAFGENVALGLLHKFPSRLVNAWSSGTGLAGLLGSGIYIIFGCLVGSHSGDKTEMRDLNKKAFLLTTPVVLLYWLSYFLLIKTPPSAEGTQNVKDDGQVSINEDVTVDGREEKPLLEDTSDTIASPEDIPAGQTFAAARNNETMIQRYWRCFKLVAWLCINLSAVYMFEYVARACAAKVRPKNEYGVGCPELYSAIQLCYQAGVFASRSSVQIFQIRRVEVLTALQGINMVVWLFDVHYKFMPTAMLPAYMIFVGLLGGASYVNIFYLILMDDIFPSKDREVCINITALFITLGIILGTGLETVLFTTLLKND